MPIASSTMLFRSGTLSLLLTVLLLAIILGLLLLNELSEVVQAPDKLVSSPRNKGVFLQWIDIPNATDFLVEYKESPAINWTTFPHPPSATSGIFVDHLSNNTSYDFRVSTVAQEGRSEPSPISSATPTQDAVDGSNKLIISTGQSNAIGAYGGPVLSTAQPYSNRMLNAGHTGFIPLTEPIAGPCGGWGETISSGLANSLSHSVSAYSSIICLCGAVSAPYAALMHGTPAYTSLLSNVTVAKNLSLQENRPLEVKALTVIHGESDEGAGTTAEQYAQYLLEWQHDYETDIKAITGQTGPVPLFTDQVSSWLSHAGASPEVALGQYKAAKEHGERIILVTPKYIFDYTDALHLTSYSQRRLGEYYAKVYKKLVIDGEQWEPLMPARIAMYGNVITATFHVPVPPLVIDPVGVALNDDLGFEYTDDSHSASITDVAIIGPETVRITLSNTPTGADPRLRYAYTGSEPWSGATSGGAGGNLRDSDMTRALHQDTAVPFHMGYYLHNWMVTFDEPITSL